MGAHFEALDEGVLLVPLDHRYTQVGFNLVSVQVCLVKFDLLSVASTMLVVKATLPSLILVSVWIGSIEGMYGVLAR